jgi:hypothetical protein
VQLGLLIDELNSLDDVNVAVVHMFIKNDEVKVVIIFVTLLPAFFLPTYHLFG